MKKGKEEKLKSTLCRNCNQYTHHADKCPNKKGGGDKGKGKSGKFGKPPGAPPGPAPKGGKWCTLHNTASHDSSECKTLLNKGKGQWGKGTPAASYPYTQDQGGWGPWPQYHRSSPQGPFDQWNQGGGYGGSPSQVSWDTQSVASSAAAMDRAKKEAVGEMAMAALKMNNQFPGQSTAASSSVGCYSGKPGGGKSGWGQIAKGEKCWNVFLAEPEEKVEF